MKKKIMSLALALVMCLTLAVPAFAVESDPVFTGPYAELKTSIYQQLKAQHKLEHFELQLAALLPQENKTTRAVSSTQSWYAPNGGELCYMYDYTYRGENGYVATSTTYMAPTDTNACLANKYGTVGSVISAATGIAVGKLSKKIAMFEFLGDITPAFTTLSVIGILNDRLVRKSIDDADRYSKLCVVYDSISGGYSKVLVGWDTHPTVTLNWPSAYNVSFN
jgi:hypothetical protein